MTSINLDQQLGLIVAPGAPTVAEDQSLALIVEQRLQPQTIFTYIDQLLALIVAHRIVDLVELVGGSYQDFLGNPLANGYLLMNINTPSEVYTNGDEVIEGSDLRFKITLDSNGNCVSGQRVFSTDVLTPVCQYSVQAFAADGTTASTPQTVTVPSSGVSYDISQWVPLSPTF
jgi:hypothetical protein